MDLIKSIKISTAGMRVQGTRLRVISENIANADSLPDGQGDLPYRRKQVSFKNVLDRSIDAQRVKVDKIQFDKTDFDRKFDPMHPAADENGYVLVPNVNPLVEMMDMREAQRSYEANLSIIQVSKSMLTRTIDMLR
ncbi:MAG: flagellar basal body rod protein FlgC [Alphaproteobacteria bacterium]